MKKINIKEIIEKRWGIKGWKQIITIFIVFALTGSSAVFVGKTIMKLLNITEETTSDPVRIFFRIIIVFVVYQILLVWIGFMFGQFTFFWNMEKKILSRITNLFKRKKSVKQV